MTIVNLSSAKINQSIAYEKKNLVPNKSYLENLLPDDHSIEDIVSISDEAKILLKKEEKKKFLLEKKSYDYEEMLRQLRETEAPKEEDPLFKCIKISMRIMNGDSVPNKDRAYLLEHYPQMYTNAELLKRKNDDPKKYKSLLEDDKEEDAAEGVSTAESAPQEINMEVAGVDSEVSVDFEA